MKSTIAILLLATCSAVQLTAEGFPNGDPGNHHWRKPWPEGIDNGDDDGAVMNAFSLPVEKKKSEPERATYPWEYDHEIITTGKSLDIAEKQRGEKLTYESVAVKRGRDMIFENNPMHEKHLMDDRAKDPPAAEAAAAPAAAAAAAADAAPAAAAVAAAAPIAVAAPVAVAAPA